jgi:hypothetical protein
MVMRSEPSTRGGAATITSRSAVNGATVTVLETGIPDADGVTGGEWWRIVGPDGTVGYSRGIDPQGVHNFQLLA